MKNIFSGRCVSMILACTVLVSASRVAWAQDIEPTYRTDVTGSKDHPLLKRIEDSVILKYVTKKFDAHPVALGRVVFDYQAQKFNDWPKVVAEGARTTLFYRMPQDAGTLETVRGYQEELENQGLEVLFEGFSGGQASSESNTLDNGYGRFIDQVYQSEKDFGLQEYTMPGAEDFRYIAFKKPASGDLGDIYVTIFACAVTDSWKAPEKGILANTVLARVDVIETKPMKNRMVTVKAAEMEQQLNTSGRVALYGIYFDTNSATIKSESDETLLEIQKLLQSDPALKLLVVGHTDSVGGFDSNLRLSERRSASVVAALTERYGISPQRLFSFGCSFASPAAPNTTEDGRAKNRRVELVRLD